MRTLILSVTFAFILLLAVLTGVDIYKHGFTALTVPSLLILVLLGVGIFGALLNDPNE